MKNAEAAIFNRRRGRVKSLSTAGRRERGIEKFLDWGRVTNLGGGVLLPGDQYTIT